MCADLLVRDDDEGSDEEATDRAGQGGAGKDEHPASADTPALAAHVQWMRELIDEQRATIERKDAALAEAAEQAERREVMWLRQIDALTTKLLPAPEPPRSFLRRMFGG